MRTHFAASRRSMQVCKQRSFVLSCLNTGHMTRMILTRPSLKRTSCHACPQKPRLLSSKQFFLVVFLCAVNHATSPTWCLVKAGHSWRTTPYYYKNHLWGDPSLVMQRHDIQTYQFCTFLRPDRQINHSVNDRPWMRQNGPKSCGIIHAKTDSRKGIVTIYIYIHVTYVMVHGKYIVFIFWYLKILKKLYNLILHPQCAEKQQSPKLFPSFEAFTSPDPELGWPKLPRGRAPTSPSDFVGRCVTSFSTRTVPTVWRWIFADDGATPH